MRRRIPLFLPAIAAALVVLVAQSAGLWAWEDKLSISGYVGKSQVRYQATGEKGCYTFNGTTFCYAGAPRCP
jgi:hypothetical protein